MKKVLFDNQHSYMLSTIEKYPNIVDTLLEMHNPVEIEEKPIENFHLIQQISSE
jgi:hypothetical protein